jgi:RNA polymerase sigma-70 factor (ECF subfamily)
MMSEVDVIKFDEDSELVSKCRTGDMEAFEGLVRRHEKRMINVAFRMVGDFEDACEVVQDAFVSAYKNIKGFKGSAKFSTWLCAIVMNLSRNRIKRLKARNLLEPVSIDDPVATDEGSVKAEPASDGPTALEELERKEMQQKVQGCIEALDVDFREVIVLRDIQGFQYDEIENMLDVPLGTVKSRLYRARAAVSECLKKVLGAL